MGNIRGMLGLFQQNLSKVLGMANLTITWVDIIEILIISFTRKTLLNVSMVFIISFFEIPQRLW